MKQVLAVVCFVLPLSAQNLVAQAPAAQPQPKFEIASVRMIDLAALQQANYTMHEDSEMVSYERVPLRRLILKAWQVEEYQVIWPKWIGDLAQRSDVDRYTIVARIPPGSAQGEIPLMLRQLLVERFHITTHHESRNLPIYAVTVPSGGVRISRVADPLSDAYKGPTYTPTGWHIVGDHPISRLLKLVNSEVTLPLIDMTGLEGYYHVDLVWDRPVQIGPADTGSTPNPDSSVPSALTPGGGLDGSLFSAMEKQLGLKVEKRVASTDVLVIDTVDRIPIAN